MGRHLDRRMFGGSLAAALLGGPALAQHGDPVIPRTPMRRPGTFTMTLASPESVGMSAERLRRIGEWMDRHVAENTISGAVTALARRGKVVHYEAHGYANAATKAPMTRDAMFRMASSTKPVAGVALLMMIEEGRVRLTDPVSRFIPEFRDTKVAVLRPGAPRVAGQPPQVDLVPANRPITILDLATHTSGLMSGGPGAAVSQVQRRPGETLATYIARLGAVPLDFQPGTQWDYSGGAGIDILGRVVEVASGQDFDTFLRQRIFEPLGMVDTHFNVPAAKRPRLLPQQAFTNGAWRVTPPPATPPAPSVYFSGAGGLTSTAADYLRFEQMLVNKGEFNGRRLLGTRTVELMGTNHVRDLFDGTSGRTQGHGFGITVRVVLDHVVGDTGRSNGAFGWGGAFGTVSWTDPAEEIAGVIMLQQREVQVQTDYEEAVRQAIID